MVNRTVQPMDPETPSMAASADASELSRRAFLSASLLTGGGLMLSLTMPQTAAARIQEAATQLTGFIRIAADGTVTILAKNPEPSSSPKAEEEASPDGSSWSPAV